MWEIVERQTQTTTLNSKRIQEQLRNLDIVFLAFNFPNLSFWKPPNHGCVWNFEIGRSTTFKYEYAKGNPLNSYIKVNILNRDIAKNLIFLGLLPFPFSVKLVHVRNIALLWHFCYRIPEHKIVLKRIIINFLHIRIHHLFWAIFHLKIILFGVYFIPRWGVNLLVSTS